MLFADEPELRLLFLMYRIWSDARRWMETQVKTLDVTLPQFTAIVALTKSNGITQRELSEQLERDATTTMVICDSLEKKGLIQRKPDLSDRRVNRLVLTKKSKAIFDKAYPLIQKEFNGMLSGIPVKEMKCTLRMLEKLHQDACILPNVLLETGITNNNQQTGTDR